MGPSYQFNSLRSITHICIGNLASHGPDNGLSPGRRQAIIWTDLGILLIGPLGTNFSEILIDIYTFSFTKMHLKMSSAKWHPFCLGLNVLSKMHASYLQKWQSEHGKLDYLYGRLCLWKMYVVSIISIYKVHGIDLNHWCVLMYTV